MYERGELKFPDLSQKFLLCHCCQFPEFHRYPHFTHNDELGRFEMESYARRKK